jgi:hypothetical protein
MPARRDRLNTNGSSGTSRRRRLARANRRKRHNRVLRCGVAHRRWLGLGLIASCLEAYGSLRRSPDRRRQVDAHCPAVPDAARTSLSATAAQAAGVERGAAAQPATGRRPPRGRGASADRATLVARAGPPLNRRRHRRGDCASSQSPDDRDGARYRAVRTLVRHKVLSVVARRFQDPVTRRDRAPAGAGPLVRSGCVGPFSRRAQRWPGSVRSGRSSTSRVRAAGRRRPARSRCGLRAPCRARRPTGRTG